MFFCYVNVLSFFCIIGLSLSFVKLFLVCILVDYCLKVQKGKVGKGEA